MKRYFGLVLSLVLLVFVLGGCVSDPGLKKAELELSIEPFQPEGYPEGGWFFDIYLRIKNDVKVKLNKIEGIFYDSKGSVIGKYTLEGEVIAAFCTDTAQLKPGIEYWITTVWWDDEVNIQPASVKFSVFGIDENGFDVEKSIVISLTK